MERGKTRWFAMAMVHFVVLLLGLATKALLLSVRDDAEEGSSWRKSVEGSTSRFRPTFELGAAQITSGADRLGEPKNQFSEL